MPFVAVLIGKHGVGECLAVARGAAIVDHERGPSMRRVDLVLEIERGSLLAVRAAVNVDDQRIFSIRAKIRRVGQKRFHGPLVVVADEAESFHRLHGFAGQRVMIQIGKLPGRDRRRT